MKNINGTDLADMTINVLERTAMVLAEPAKHGDEHPPATHLARITYRGPSQGMLVLGTTDGFLRELAAGLLGVDTAEVNLDTHGGDALKEMANIVGGSLILALAGDSCEYSLGLPELLALNDAPGQGRGSARARCTVVAEGGALHVYWHEASIARAA